HSPLLPRLRQRLRVRLGLYVDDARGRGAEVLDLDEAGLRVERDVRRRRDLGHAFPIGPEPDVEHVELRRLLARLDRRLAETQVFVGDDDDLAARGRLDVTGEKNVPRRRRTGPYPVRLDARHQHDADARMLVVEHLEQRLGVRFLERLAQALDLVVARPLRDDDLDAAG